jgi:molybdopterin converting factor small subunit
MIRVVLPAHLRTLAQVPKEIDIEVIGIATQRSVIDALEVRYPVLVGTIHNPLTKERRKFIRFFACEDDLSHDSPDMPLPDAVVNGAEPFFIIGAMAGG